ncbi:hypothetical protein AVEN_162829-1 [Araneus ventricosus]|uniref:Uncharacterized protein n=1 Tax=Araneus ventricosus TaxID=182803 RepID=A0A4Y2C6M0_ARAVE|nr:hypothetical protein AVEN_162829-1 [Araneus ventricosus]
MMGGWTAITCAALPLAAPLPLTHNGKPAGVVSPKPSRILLEKGAVSPPPAWIKKFEPIVTQDPMIIRKYLGKKSNSKRCVPIKRIPISTLSSLKDNPSACTGFYQVRMRMENRMKKKRQAGVNKYRAQKIASNTHAHGVEQVCDYTDRQTISPLTDLAQNFIRTYIHDDKTVYEILSF